jgi:predicted phosphodiesterase
VNLLLLNERGAVDDGRPSALVEELREDAGVFDALEEPLRTTDVQASRRRPSRTAPRMRTASSGCLRATATASSRRSRSCYAVDHGIDTLDRADASRSQIMNLQIMSDLHFEMHADGGAGFIRELDPTGVDVLVLAGDITMARQYEDLASVFRPLAQKYPRVLYVPGNHEYYKSSPADVARNLAQLTKKFPEVTVPENDTVVIHGQRFIAGTMWFRPDPVADLKKCFMNDFSLIQNFEPWVYEQNAAFEKVLAIHVEADDVVVTHHLPAFESVPARFAHSAINAFFVCDMASQMREHQPKLWIHGHSHDRCDYMLGKTRVVANPLGYPNEVKSLEAFDPTFQVAI